MIESMLEYFANSSPGYWAGPILGLIAFVETLFPPFPGDIIFIVISGWAISTGFPFILAAVYGVAGCFIASCILFYVGHKPGKQFVEVWVKRKVEPEKVNKAKELIVNHGSIILALSRFVPGIRSLLVIMAGSSGMRFVMAVIPVAFSAIAWYTILSAAGLVFGENIKAAEGFMKHFEIWIWIVLAVSLFAFLIFRYSGRKKIK